MFDLDAVGRTGNFFTPDFNKTSLVLSSTVTTSLKASTVTTSLRASTVGATASRSSVTVTQTQAAAATSANSGSRKHDVAIGVGAGVPIAVAALSILGILLFREHKRREHAEKVVENHASINRQAVGSQGQADGWQSWPHSGLDGPHIARELSSTPAPLKELQSRQIHEAGNGR